MKKVFNNKELCHVWANQGQEYGKSDNMFFEGIKIYSYGSHYLAAKIHNVNGKEIALVNSNRYSNTTAKHLNEIRSSLYGLMDYFVVPNPNELNDEENYIYLSNILFDWFTLCTNNKSGFKFSQEMFRMHLFKLHNFETLTNRPITIIDEEFLEDLKAISEEKEKRDKIKSLKKEEIRKEKIKELLSQGKEELHNWLNGSVKFPNSIFLNDLGYHPIRIKDNEVETTGGAKVPLEHALRLLARIENSQKIEDVKIGHYTVENEVSKNRLKIGCHIVDINQAKEVLKA